MVKKALVLVSFVVSAGFSTACLAQSGGISIPGIGKVQGSTGSTVKDSKIRVANNKALNVIAAGGEGLGVSVGSTANVNSVNITGSQVTSSTIDVSGNKADNVISAGGTANVNSVNIN